MAKKERSEEKMQAEQKDKQESLADGTKMVEDNNREKKIITQNIRATIN